MADAPDQLFRAAALKQLNSPDDLDRLVRVTGPIGWIAGLALTLMIAAVLVWSVVGHLPTRVPGTGILLPQGGRIVEVQARGSGVLTQLLVTVGDRVEAGQVIGRLGETEGERELETARLQLADRRRDLAQAESGAEGEQRLRAESLRRQRASIELRAQIARGREVELRERLATTESLFRERLVTRAQLIGVQNEIAATRQELSAAASDTARLGSEELELRRSSDERMRERQRAVDEAERRFTTQAGSLGDQLILRSPNAGSVLEIRTQTGALVRQGQPVLALDQRGEGLEVIAFVDSQNGKRLRPGMEARVAVASARREEVGTLEGEVASVSDFPLSFDAIRALIQNEDLARSFIQRGPPFLVRVRLRPDPNSASGYRWTSRRGDEVTISSGVPASVEIVTALRRPIAMVIPTLRGFLSL
jgi:HlyD family secretion protein